MFRPFFCFQNPNPNKGPKRQLDLKDEFLLTLVRLRRGTELQMLADMFSISKTSAISIFATWLCLLNVTLVPMFIKWPSRRQVRKSMRHVPSFKGYSNTRAIIDCTEFAIQKPSLPSSQRRTWSSYKSRNTVKALIATSPRGTFTYISKLWTGNTSDRAIVKGSTDFLEKLEFRDDIMSDKGFLIKNLLSLFGATLNRPPFCYGKQLSAKAVCKTRRIARARIHVERAIGALKNFRILDGTIPLKLKPQLDMILQVCAALCNVRKYLVR